MVSEQAPDESVALSDNQWFLSHLNHDITKFQKLQVDAKNAQTTLQSKEKEYQQMVKGNVAQAMMVHFYRCLHLGPSLENLRTMSSSTKDTDTANSLQTQVFFVCKACDI